MKYLYEYIQFLFHVLKFLYRTPPKIHAANSAATIHVIKRPNTSESVAEKKKLLAQHKIG